MQFMTLNNPDQEYNRKTQQQFYLAYPCAQKAYANLSIVIQIGIQSATALGEVTEEWGHSWIDIGELDVK